MRTAIALLLLSLAACGDDASVTPEPDASVTPTPDAAPRQVVMEDKMLLVGEIAEAIMTGGAGDVARIRLTAPSTLDWNIHGHAGGSTQNVFEEFGVTTVDYTFAPTAQADWYLLVRNQSGAVMTVGVTLEFHANMQWSGWE